MHFHILFSDLNRPFIQFFIIFSPLRSNQESLSLKLQIISCWIFLFLVLYLRHQNNNLFAVVSRQTVYLWRWRCPRCQVVIIRCRFSHFSHFQWGLFNEVSSYFVILWYESIFIETCYKYLSGSMCRFYMVRMVFQAVSRITCCLVTWWSPLHVGMPPVLPCFSHGN